jgi:cyclopropane-fatty-acyl-phospholipid synthase
MTDPVFALEPDIPRNVRLARWLLFRLLSGIREGSLTVREGAQTFHFGDPAAALRAEARAHAGGVLASTDRRQPAAAEAWMDGDWESHQLTALLQILARNGEVLGRLERGFVCWASPSSGCATGRAATRARRRGRISPPITISATNFMPTFWMTTCSTPARCLPTTAGSDPGPAGQNGAPVRPLALTPGDHLLEIGTGWGRWPNTPPAITAAGSPPPPCRRNSSSWANARMARAGLQDRVEVLLCDYRDLPASTTNCCRWR